MVNTPFKGSVQGIYGILIVGYRASYKKFVLPWYGPLIPSPCRPITTIFKKPQNRGPYCSSIGHWTLRQYNNKTVLLFENPGVHVTTLLQWHLLAGSSCGCPNKGGANRADRRSIQPKQRNAGSLHKYQYHVEVCGGLWCCIAVLGIWGQNIGNIEASTLLSEDLGCVHILGLG